LLELRQLCEETDSDFRFITEEIQFLNLWNSEIRYPGASASVEEAREALGAVKRARKFVRAKLGFG